MMPLYIELQLTPRAPLTSLEDARSDAYLESVQRAAAELNAAQPWLLVRYLDDTGWRVAASRTFAMMLVTAFVNVGRRVRRWWRGRLQLAYEVRQSKGNRNG